MRSDLAGTFACPPCFFDVAGVPQTFFRLGAPDVLPFGAPDVLPLGPQLLFPLWPGRSSGWWPGRCLSVWVAEQQEGGAQFGGLSEYSNMSKPRRVDDALYVHLITFSCYHRLGGTAHGAPTVIV